MRRSGRAETVFVVTLAVAFGSASWALFRGDATDKAAPEPAVPGFTPRIAEEFVNFETPHVHPLDITPDGTRLLAVNTADNRLMVFSLLSGRPVLSGEVSVGLDPVAVRARSSTEAWVVNHISDSVSIVDLTTLSVVRTLRTKDEPCDVVFAGTPQRAFVTCSAVDLVQVFDPANPGATPLEVAIEGQDPRALAVSPDGSIIYAAVFESGNRTTILGGGSTGMGTVGFPPNVVSDAAGPYAGTNPPPNAGGGFSPAQTPGNPAPPRVGQIIRQNDAGAWMDDNGRDWTALVSGPQASLSGRLPGWTLVDQDIAAINTSTLGVTYASHLMNLCMGVSVNPVTGAIAVVGTDATNEVRFEPNVNGRFVRVTIALVNPLALTDVLLRDMNPHLTYAAPTAPQSERNRSIGDPRAVAWNPTGQLAYVAGMGSNNLIVLDQAGNRVGLHETIPVGEGPTGLAVDAARNQLYVMNKFEGSISVVSLATEVETDRIPFFDPTPPAIKVGRKHLYDTHRNSGLGQAACASCHIDARMDRLAWDLGDPSGSVDPLGANNLGFGFPGLEPNTTQTPYEPFHPMKGPMTTQTLQDIIGHEPLHWRGDRAGLEAFNGAFIGLQGDDANLTPAEMQEFEDFLATIHFPPNPFRNFDNSLPTSLALPGHYTTGRFGAPGQPLPAGNAQAGMTLYRSTSRPLDGTVLACVTCHTLPTGAGPDLRLQGFTYQNIPAGPHGERHRALVSVDGSANISIKIPQTRNVADKSGFNTTILRNTAGFGFLHDGSVDSAERFVSEPVFDVRSDQEVANLTAFMLCFSGSDLPEGSMTNPQIPPGGTSKDAHAAVGWQTTLRDAGNPDPGQAALIASMIAQANLNRVGLVVKGRVGGVARGYAYSGANTFQSDREGETISAAALQSLAAPGSELTYTVVPFGSQVRIGIDRDLDGCYDRDYAEGVCGCVADFNNSRGTPDDADVAAFFLAWNAGDPGADVNQSGGTPDDADIAFFFTHWNAGC